MLFNSLSFLLFFPLVCVVFFMIPTKATRWRNLFLLFSSYYFYMCWEPFYALLILFCTIVTFLVALSMGKVAHKKFLLIAGIIANLAVLVFFKYHNFLASNINASMELSGLRMHVPLSSFMVPVGISFYTFQALGYMVDVYRGKVEAEKDFIAYALFVSFFPQLVAGPIERSNRLLPQFHAHHDYSHARMVSGLMIVLWGYFLKLVLADRCALYTDVVFNNAFMYNGSSFLTASVLFTLQIYGDFAGYSFIAIGVARILGFRLCDNFRQPFFASSISDYWRRWHISLSSWFMDYVYIPLGGNRKGKLRTYINLMTTFLVSGLWHGANWTYLLWGGLHGGLVCAERALGVNKAHFRGVRRILGVCLTFFLLCLAFIVFRSSNLTTVVYVFDQILHNMGRPRMEVANFLAVAIAVVILFLRDFSAENHRNLLPRRGVRRSVAIFSYIVLMTVLILAFGVLDGSQFIYFQF